MQGSSTARRAARTLALATGLVALAAPAADAYVGGPGNGKRLTTSAPDLRSAQITASDTTDDLPNVVRFCFDQVVNQIPFQTRFYVYTYDATRWMQASEAVVAPGVETCVDAKFGDDLDIGEGTVALVDEGAVRDSNDRPNASQTEPLASRVAPVEGRSTGPDLVDAVREGTNRVVFRFDEELDQSPITDPTPDTPANENNAAVASRFRFLRSTGTQAVGQAVVNNRASRYTITIDFGGANVGEAQRFVYDGTANVHSPRDLPQTNGGSTYAPPGVVGGNTGLPSIVGATRVSGREFKVTYSQEVDPGAQGSFVAVTDDARFGSAQSPPQQAGGDGRSLLVQFDGDLVSDAGGVVRIVDLGGGAQSDGAGIASTLSQFATGVLNQRPGYTAGPDLEAAFFDAALDRITYRFDEDLRQNADFDEAQFRAYTGAPDFVSGLAGTTPIVDGRSVTVRFPDTIDNSVGAGVIGGGVFDRIFSRNPWGTVSYELEPFPAAPPAPTQPSGTPAPVAVPPRVRYVTEVSFKRAGRSARRKYSGRLRSQGRGCRSGRRVVIKRIVNGRARTVTSVFTKGDGTFVLRRKRIPGRVYAFVTERGGTQVFCRSGKSRTIRG